MQLRWAAVAVALGAACGPSDRERDCGEVKQILEMSIGVEAHGSGVPRRYYDYAGHKGDTAIVDMSPFEKLKRMHYRDTAVRDAVNAYVTDTGWTVYSPYDSRLPMGALDKLEELCGWPRQVIVDETR